MKNETGDSYLIDGHDAAADRVACEFVFKSEPETKNVSLFLPPFSRLTPDKFVMERAAGSDNWSVTVDLPTASRFLYAFVIDRDPGDLKNAPPRNSAFRDSLIPDPNNPLRPYPQDNRSIFETPGCEPPKYLEEVAGTPKGKLDEIEFHSSIYGRTRKIWIYTPPNYDPSSKYPLLVLLDGEIYLREMRAATVLDNLIAENAIPPVVCAFVDNPREDREKELTGSSDFAAFLSDELVSHMRRNYGVSTDPQATIIGGASYGGLASVHTALSHPATFGRALSQSGSFWKNWDGKLAAGEANVGQVMYLEAGLFEIEQMGGASLLEANRHTARFLAEHGVEINYSEFRGGHGAHNWRGTFPAALTYLLNYRKYRAA